MEGLITVSLEDRFHCTSRVSYHLECPSKMGLTVQRVSSQRTEGTFKRGFTV